MAGLRCCSQDERQWEQELEPWGSQARIVWAEAQAVQSSGPLSRWVLAGGSVHTPRTMSRALRGLGPPHLILLPPFLQTTSEGNGAVLACVLASLAPASAAVSQWMLRGLLAGAEPAVGTDHPHAVGLKGGFCGNDIEDTGVVEIQKSNPAGLSSRLRGRSGKSPG